MKRATLFALVAVALLFALPAAAQEAGAAEPLFAAAATPGCPAPTMTFNEAPEPAETSLLGPCTVSRRCLDGSSVSCTGFDECHSGPSQGGGWVECDGNRTYCPYDPDCNVGYFCKKHSDCYCYDLLCACTGTCVCAQEG